MNILVTGGAGYIGSHTCVELLQAGHEVVVVDNLCNSREEALRRVERIAGRQLAFHKADVRERSQLKAAVDAGLAKFGKIDIVCANAGILPIKTRDTQSFVDAMDVDFGGVLNTVGVTLEHLTAGASIILTGSTAGLIEGSVNNPVLGPGGSGYGLAKAFIVKYTEVLALQVAEQMIRVNAIHPTNCNTNLLHNEDLYKLFRPDIANPTREDVLPAFNHFQAMPIPYIEPVDISNAVLWLASDEARYVTGVNLRGDAGSFIKSPTGI